MEVLGAGSSSDPSSDPSSDARLRDVMRCNGFESGVYCYRSLFNDGGDPSCVNWIADDGTAEVWTCRAVGAGEALTLDYSGGAGTRAMVLQAHGIVGAPAPVGDLDRKLLRAVPLLEARSAALGARIAKDHVASRSASVAALRHRKLAGALLEDVRFVAARAAATDNAALRRRARAVAAEAHALAAAEVFDGAEAEAPRAANDNRPDAYRLLGDALRFAALRLDDLPRDHPDVSEAAGAAAEALRGLLRKEAPLGSVAASLRGSKLAKAAKAPGDVLLLATRLRARADLVAARYDSRRWLLPADP